MKDNIRELMKHTQWVNNMKSGMVKVMKGSNIISEGILVCKISYIKTFWLWNRETHLVPKFMVKPHREKVELQKLYCGLYENTISFGKAQHFPTADVGRNSSCGLSLKHPLSSVLGHKVTTNVSYSISQYKLKIPCLK